VTDFIQWKRSNADLTVAATGNACKDLAGCLIKGSGNKPGTRLGGLSYSAICSPNSARKLLWKEEGLRFEVLYREGV